ncbi:sulfate permease [Actinomycetaceae bacterium MB13-C1-2]|nr:sulfate permease [Actinomycetaceae bacterium MB13-C1-2]
MIHPILAMTSFIYSLLQRYAPSNIALRCIRSRRGLKWGVPAVLLALPYLGLAFWCSFVAAGGGSAWLIFLVLLSLWNALKFIAFGPISLMILSRVRVKELNERRDGEKVSAPALN